MNRKEPITDFSREVPFKEAFSLDFKRIFFKGLQHWYLVALSLLLGLVCAFLINRYSKRIYPVTASIIVKEADDISGGELLYNNPLVNFKRNYLNEPYIIKSYPLIQAAIEDLSFDAAFYKEGNILTTETYEEFPVRVRPIRNGNLEYSTFDFQVLDEDEFQLKPSMGNSEQAARRFKFNDTVTFDGFRGRFEVTSLQGLRAITNEKFIFNYTPPIVLAKTYVSKLNVEWAEEGAGVINLSINGSSPAKEKDFLVGLIRRYQDFDLEVKNQTASRTVEFISDQLDGISDSLRRVERKLEQFKNRNVVTDLGSEALRLYKRIEDLETEKTHIIVSRNYYKYLIDYIANTENAHQIILPTSVGISDPILSNLISRMNDIQLDIKMAGKEKNPLVLDAAKRINEIKRDIIESVRNQESTDQIKFDFLQKQVSALDRQLQHLPTAERTLISIQRNYALLENLYIFLLQKRSEAAISKASNTSDIIIVDPPMQVAGSIYPMVARNYVFAGLLGLLMPFVVFFLLEVFNIRVQSREDIEKITTMPFIGGVGHKRSSNNLEVLTHPKTSIAESFRALRSNLNYFIGNREKGVFLITSSISGEGKTFTSINLASVLALSGRQTLIVGADMRRPKIFGDFNLSNDIGLSTYLAGLAKFDDVVQKTSYGNLDLISGGPVPPNPSELLLTARMEEFINEAKGRYDYIILDTPPLAIVTDAFILATFADHSLFLVRQNYTPKVLLRTVEDFYSTGRLTKISIVLNDIYKSGPGYGYSYSYGYDYVYGKRSTGYGEYYSDEVQS